MEGIPRYNHAVVTVGGVTAGRIVYGEAVWSSEAWRGEAVAWLDERLAEVGLTRTAEAEQPHLRPWATALRAPTTGGVVWMKAAGPATAFEVGLYELLHRVAPDHVLRPIATDTGRGWMILEDGGSTAEGLEGAELVEAMAAAFERYGQLQRLVAPHSDELVPLGATDMRPAVLPERFEQALSVVGAWAEREGGPAEAGELERLHVLRPQVRAWCEELAAAPGGASIDHNDLHPDNVFAGPPPRAYDWGDSVVAHPFASMLVTLDFMGEHAPRLRDAYLEGFADLASHAELVRTLNLARRLAVIAHALTWDRVLGAMPAGEIPAGWAGTPVDFLARLLNA